MPAHLLRRTLTVSFSVSFFSLPTFLSHSLVGQNEGMSLIVACYENQIETAAKLLQFGANKNHRDKVIFDR
jgi:hypothetical protein